MGKKGGALTSLTPDCYFGLHPAGHGIWSARIWSYLNRCIIPVISSDGVVMPFERVLDYSRFTTKLLSGTYEHLNFRPVRRMLALAAAARLEANVSSTTTGVVLQTSSNPTGTTQDAAIMYAMQNNTKEAAPWMNWASEDKLRNPFTLIQLELLCFSRHRESHQSIVSFCSRPRSRIAKAEYYPGGKSA